MKWRIVALQGLFLVWTLLLILRLAYWQVVQANDLRDQAELQHFSFITIPSARGEIKSSDGFPLVSNRESYLLYANPQKLTTDRFKIAELLSIIPASDSAKAALDKFSNSELYWVALAHQVPLDTKKQIESLGLEGLGFEVDPSRIYPEGSPSAYLTGFTGKDDLGQPKGYFGLEGFYDRLLSGRPGKLIQERDAFNRPIVIGNSNRIPPQDGSSLITSIDRTIQFIAFQKLEEGLRKYQASSGTVSIMDTKTGQILAMVSLPGYDQSAFLNFESSLYKNPLVSDSYEPGSTFKTIIMASALDAGVVKPETRCTACVGPVVIGDHSVKSYNDKYYPDSTMTDIILHSDNVGMVFVSRKLGKDKMLNYIRKFGFGSPTGIDLQEESSPELRPDHEWRDIDWATASFGQGIAVTPIQMLTGVNTIANLGVLVPPRIVTQVATGAKVKELPPPDTKRVISPQAAAQITQMMINGANNGEVRYYKPSGYTIAGKTGTAQIPIAGHYDPNKFIASFIGFAPAEDPKFTMLVTLRDPKTSPWGSTTAAPLWFEISKELFRNFQIPPSVTN